MAHKDTFGERLNRLLYEQKLSQVELDRRTGIGRANISRYVCNKQIPTVDSLISICKTLNVSADWLLGLSDRKERDT
jgi:transcriptional regulator with XRE-family HTH domain